ncbi:MAG: hypothetical protein ACLU8D_04475 [Enterocloster sp.]
MNPRTEKRRHGRYAWAELGDRLILTLVLAGIALFILYPIVSVVATSFFKDGHFTLEYYRSWRPDGALLIRNSLWVSSLSSILTTAAAFFIALAAYAAPGRIRRFLRRSLLYHDLAAVCIGAGIYLPLEGGG